MGALAVTEPRGYRHGAVVYRGDDDFVDTLAPFVRDGIDRDEPVLVAVVRPKIDLLRDALGGGAATESVQFVDMARLGRNPAHIIPKWLAFVAAHASSGSPVRGIGEPIWATRRPAEVAECQLHEALLDVAVDPATSFDLRCLYDADALDDTVIAEARRAHAHGDGRDHDGARQVQRLFAAPLPQPARATEALTFSSTDLRPVRDAVTRRAEAAGIARRHVHDLVLAVHEVATNSIVHGGGAGTVRMWDDADAFIVEIHDAGRVDDPLAGRLPPDLERTGGRGLWLAHQLCDLVQLRSSERGTVVRLLTWR